MRFAQRVAAFAIVASLSTGVANAGDLGPLEKYKDQAKDSIELNEDGKKFAPFEFDHAAHVTDGYLRGGNCSSCHHTQQDDSAAPKPCENCHDVGGDAGEKKAKAKAYHSKKSEWGGPSDEGGVSCVGCHKAHNKDVKAGKVDGGKAPAKCSGCHAKKPRD